MVPFSRASSWSPDRAPIGSILSPIKQYRTHTRTSTEARRTPTRYEPADKLLLAAVAQIHQAINRGSYHHVFRTDVRVYYDAIDPDILMAQLRPLIPEPEERSLLHQYLHRCVRRDGVFRRIDYGIPTGCVLSPLMAAAYLTPLDRAMEASESRGIFYVLYRDDLVILTPTRAKLRLAIRTVNQHLSALRLEQHPDKTFIGKLSRGVDALGTRFDATRRACGPSRTAAERLGARIVERYAQHEGGESLRHSVNRLLDTQNFGFSPEKPEPPQSNPENHHHETSLRPIVPHCPEKNHTSSPTAGHT